MGNLLSELIDEDYFAEEEHIASNTSFNEFNIRDSFVAKISHNVTLATESVIKTVLNTHIHEQEIFDNVTVPESNLTYDNYTYSNETLIVTAQWRLTLDKVATVIMMINTIALMLGMGAAIYWKQIWHHMKKPIGCIIGMVCQFGILPLTCFTMAYTLNFTTPEAMGALIVSCSPGGSFSNFFTYWMDGDLALSIVMTSFSSVIAFGGMPFNLWLYSRYWISNETSNFVLPYKSILVSLCFIMGPVVVGMVIRHFTEKVASISGYVLTTIVLIIWFVLYWQVFAQATPYIYLATWLLPVLGFSLAYGIAKLLCQPHKICRTIGIETGSQNMPVALSIILLTFHEPRLKAEMIIFPTMYGIILLIEMFLAIGGFQAWRKYCRRTKDDECPMEHSAKLEKGTMEEKTKLRHM